MKSSETKYDNMQKVEIYFLTKSNSPMFELVRTKHANATVENLIKKI